VGTPHKQFDLFNIPFEVPYKNATQDLAGITSQMQFSTVLSHIAERMDTHISLLSSIGYIPSYKPKSPKPVPKLLEDEDAWCKLLEGVSDYITASKKKNKGHGTVKPFHILIVDTSGPLGGSDTKLSCIWYPSK